MKGSQFPHHDDMLGSFFSVRKQNTDLWHRIGCIVGTDFCMRRFSSQRNAEYGSYYPFIAIVSPTSIRYIATYGNIAYTCAIHIREWMILPRFAGSPALPVLSKRTNLTKDVQPERLKASIREGKHFSERK